MTRTTERLVLRPWREADAESLYRYACDGEVRAACYYAVSREDWEKEVRHG